MSAKRKAFFQSAFTLVEVVFAVAIIAAAMAGVAAVISFWGKQAERIEDEREIAGLLLSAKTCVKGFWVAALRAVPTDSIVPVHFWNDHSTCLTGSVQTGTYDYGPSPKIVLKTVSGSGTESVETEREYGAYFTVSTSGLPTNSAAPTLTITNGTITKTLGFRVDEK